MEEKESYQTENTKLKSQKEELESRLKEKDSQIELNRKLLIQEKENELKEIQEIK